MHTGILREKLLGDPESRWTEQAEAARIARDKGWLEPGGWTLGPAVYETAETISQPYKLGQSAPDT
jgi:hypothetical protein